MDSDIYRKKIREYETKREKKINEANKLKEKIYSDFPNLQKLEDEKNILAVKTTRNMVTMSEMDKQIEQENLEIKLKKIDEKIEKEFKKQGIDKSVFKPKFDCMLCEDTGFVFENGKNKYCSCFTQEVINETYKQINLEKIYEENFESFDLCYYSDVVDEKKYGVNKSPKMNVEQIKKIASTFADNILSKDQKNLLFIGNTGLGKTFLSNCIAKKVLENGNSVIYQTAPIFIDKILKLSFSFDEKDKIQYEKIYDVDLLIIDDLGTETMTNNKYTELFKIINTRITKNKKILISTNLTLNQLFERYDERLISRLIGEFNICKFIGEDIRIKKKRLSHN